MTLSVLFEVTGGSVIDDRVKHVSPACLLEVVDKTGG